MAEDIMGNEVDTANFGQQVAAQSTSLANKASNLANSFDPSSLRRSTSDVLSSFGSSLQSTARTSARDIKWLGAGVKTCGPGWTAPEDWRVKVSVAPGSTVLYDRDGMTFLQPIKDTGGVIFPITPQIQMTYTAKYSSAALTHSNYAMHFYEGSEVGSIQLNGEFPVQNIEEGQYLLAAVYFFRAATKMYWGDDEWAGTPPPMVFLTGYGAHYFPNVPCVITQFMHTMPEDKDFIEIPSPGGADKLTTRLPTQSTLQLQLQPIYSRSSLKDFNLDDFANGELLQTSSRGGFI